MTRILTAALLTAIAAVSLSVAGRAEQPASSRSYTSSQAISHSFGSKRAVGYFARENGACALTMFLTEAEDGHVAPSAARVRFLVRPGDAAELFSAEGQGLEVACGKDAAAMEVRQTGRRTASATQ